LPLRKAVLDYKPIGGDPNRQIENSKDNSNEAGTNHSSNGANNFGGANNNINNTEKDMLYELHLLFKNLSGHKKSRGAYNHKRFMSAIKSSNALFDNDEHHDSHEFINWLLDKVHEDFLKNSRAANSNSNNNGGRGAASAN
jgi:ubiquitin C-terminal hydrolase